MTGIADLYLLMKKPHSMDARKRAATLLRSALGGRQTYEFNRFVVLSWKRTGSNLLCGVLFNHPEIAMHNELFNPIDIFSYYQSSLLRNEEGDRWTPLGRDLYGEAFLEHIWTGRDIAGNPIKPHTKSVGFKSFPDHWWEARNDAIFERHIMDDVGIKKIVLFREDELAVYVSMKRAEVTGLYMTKSYPPGMKVHVEPEAFQIFLNNYSDTFRRRYKSPMRGQDTFRISYEQLIQEEDFESNILPLLWDFLGVDNTAPFKKLGETVKQADPEEDLSKVISNYEELEFCFRHTDVKHFEAKRALGLSPDMKGRAKDLVTLDRAPTRSWSILLPICSRNKKSNRDFSNFKKPDSSFDSNRFHDLAVSSQYNDEHKGSHLSEECWNRLQAFADSLERSSSSVMLQNTECIVGVDVDDPVYSCQGERIKKILPCHVKVVDIRREMYGKLCRIWNFLGTHAENDFIVLLGDDVLLLDDGWQSQVENKFQEISERQDLPFGAACVALNDLSFPGFPTFPVIHRWHIEKFTTVLPRQFVNQGGDPYLFELYSRFGASAFITQSRLENTIGGGDVARYKKYEINWKGQILRLNLMYMKEHLGCQGNGVCLDVVIPSYRRNNNHILETILRLDCSEHAYVKFWLVVDNPDPHHLRDITVLADRINRERFDVRGNYFVSVLHYSENRGASYARNLGFNYSTADWTLFLDDDVSPCPHLLDAYVGAVKRYPKAKVFVGNTELPVAFNTWTKMLRTCNIMFFYGISKHVPFPPWGVTANLMVRGSRHNGTVQFKGLYPKTGGGEDIDFCFQFKQWYKKIALSERIIVAVPGATALHPWWNEGSTCYNQINGWAWGDSLCIKEWPDKCFWSFPNWVEFIFIVIPLWYLFVETPLVSMLNAALSVALIEHVLLTANYYPSARLHGQRGVLYQLFVACGAGTILSFQEATRLAAHIRRGNLHCICRRIDWNDGQDPVVKLDSQLRSLLRFVAFACVSFFCMNV
jgi:LPS sulfotransferase NodH